MPRKTSPSIRTYSLQESSQHGHAVFEIVEATGSFRRHKANFLVPHRKDYYFLAFVRKGDSRHWVDLVPYTLKPQTFYFSTPPQVHLKEQSNPLEGYLLSFTEEFLKVYDNAVLKELPLLLNRYNRHELSLSQADAVFIEDLMVKMLQEFNSNNDWKNGILASYLHILLIYTSRLYVAQFHDDDKNPGRRLLREFNTLVHRDFSKHHQVADYAAQLHISPGHLSEVVKQQSGKSAVMHIHEKLVVEAKYYLLHTEHTVKEIAHTLGFGDAAYFNRFFKRLANVTPAAYRSAIRKKYN